MGIVVLADDAVVTNNLIVSEGAEARCLVTGGSYGYIAHNNVQGAGKYAIDVVPNTLIPALTANHNFFQGNNYNLFDAALYDLHFAEGANYNVFVGHSGDVLDEGIGNEITNE